MKVYDFLISFLDKLDCYWSATPVIPCVDLTFGNSSFSIKFSLKENLLNLLIVMDETENQTTSNSPFTSDLCKEIIYGRADFTFDLQHEKDLIYYLKNRGVESLLNFNKELSFSKLDKTNIHKVYSNKIYSVLSEDNFKEVLISDSKYKNSLLYSLIVFNETQNNNLTLRTVNEHSQAIKDFINYVESNSSSGIKKLFMHERLQNTIVIPKQKSSNKTKI